MLTLSMKYVHLYWSCPPTLYVYYVRRPAALLCRALRVRLHTKNLWVDVDVTENVWCMRVWTKREWIIHNMDIPEEWLWAGMSDMIEGESWLNVVWMLGFKWYVHFLNCAQNCENKEPFSIYQSIMCNPGDETPMVITIPPIQSGVRLLLVLGQEGILISCCSTLRNGIVRAICLPRWKLLSKTSM